MDKIKLVEQIQKAQKNWRIAAPKAFLMKKTIPELRETLARANAINNVTAKEIKLHCQF